MGLLGGGKKNNVERFNAIRTNSSILGIPIPIVFGQQRIAARLLDYNDFTANKAKQQGGKGLGKGGSQFVYTASIIAALAQGPINALLNLWDSTGRFVLLSSSETHTIAGGGGTFTPANASIFGNDQGVFVATPYSVAAADYGSPGLVTNTGTQNIPFVAVPASPATGQYSVDPVTGIYSFAAADAGKVATINYSYYRYQIITRETTVVPFTGPYTVTVDNSANYKSDNGVVYFPSGTALIKVGGSPAAGQYSQSGAVYTFNVADSGQGIIINYVYNDPNTNTNAPSTLNLTLVTGQPGQAPTSYMSGKHPSKALGYTQLAYIFSSGLYLGFTPELPNYSYEIAGNFRFGAGIVDANPADCITALLTNPAFGVGFPKSFLQSSFMTGAGDTYTQVAIDNFTRANENPLNPANWTTAQNGNGAPAEPLAVVSNLCVCPTSASNANLGAALYTGAALPSDQYVEFTINTLTSGGFVGVGLRSDITTDAGYELSMGPGPLGAPVIIVLSSLGISGTTLSSITTTVNSGDTLRLEVRRNFIIARLNGVQIMSAVNSLFTSGRAFLEMSCGVNQNDVKVSKFAIGSVSGDGASVVNGPRSCWTANSFFISPVIENQSPCAHIIAPWLEAGMVGAFWSEGLLKFVPYSDATAVGNGVIYSPPTTAIANITDDNYILSSPTDDPVKITRSAWQDAYNRAQITYLARINDYNPEVVYEQDEASIGRFGLRIEDPQQYDFITSLVAAQYAASMRVQRKSYIRNEYTFNLPDTFSWLECMDVIEINDSVLGLASTPVRITKIEDDPTSGLSITAEDFIWGTAQPAYNPKNINSPYLLELGQQDPGSVTTPVIFESSHRINQGLGYQIWIGAAGLNPNWGGCHVWMSRDNLNFKPITDINGNDAITSPARVGAATTAFDYHSDPEGVPTVVPPTTGTSVPVTGGGAWSNPSNITFEGPFNSSAVTGSNNVTDLLEGGSFGFSIPGTETILGIKISVKCEETHSGVTSVHPNCQVQLTKSGALVGTPITGDGPVGTLDFVDFGGPTSLWGTTWTPSDVNTLLGVAFQGFGITGHAYTWVVDVIYVTIYLAGGTVTVALSQATQTLGSGTSSDADNLVTLCLIDNELFSYTTATLVGSGQYTLGGRIRRGQLGTSIADHSIGAPFLRIDENVFKTSLDPQFVGQTLYFKFTSFNLLGNQEEPLQNVTSYSYTPPGLHVPVTGTAPANVLSYQTRTNASGNALISFTWSAFNITRSDGSLIPVGSSNQLTTFLAPGLSTVAGGSLGARTYFVRRAMVRNGMIYAIGAEGSIAVGANQLLVVSNQLATPGYDGWMALVGTAANGEFASPTVVPFGPASFTEPVTGFVMSGNKYSDDPNGQFAVRAWNLTASTTYYLYPDVPLVSILSVLVEFANGANGAVSEPAAIAQNSQGNVALSPGPLAGGITTPAVAGSGSGSSGGGAGGGTGGSGGRFLN